MEYITATRLYDYHQCPHRVWRDLHGPQEEKIDETNPFVELLWRKGVVHEKAVVERLGKITDLSAVGPDAGVALTAEAMQRHDPLIYQGVLRHGNMQGRPDLLRYESDGVYVPIEIKSGMGLEGEDADEGESGKPKKHYALQLCLYAELLQVLGYGTTRVGYVLDIHGDEVRYELDQPMGKRTAATFWEYYEQCKRNVGILIANADRNDPALSGICKLCPWYTSCQSWVTAHDDPTGLYYVGRTKRDTLRDDLLVRSTADILGVDVEEARARKAKDKQFLRGIGTKTLEKIVARATIMKLTKQPVLYTAIAFPRVERELFFDIEDDRTREFIYLHGIYERGPEGERFIHCTASAVTPEAERQAWEKFWEYIRSLPEGSFAVYYYAPHEKTVYRRLQAKYPEVISVAELEAFFSHPNVIDLYSTVVAPYTDWPVGSYSLKNLAQYLGFQWRDETPSGALSIKWFDDYLETQDPAILERILEYNEDDCKATMVVKDKLQALSDAMEKVPVAVEMAENRN